MVTAGNREGTCVDPDNAASEARGLIMANYFELLTAAIRLIGLDFQVEGAEVRRHAGRKRTAAKRCLLIKKNQELKSMETPSSRHICAYAATYFYIDCPTWTNACC